MEYSNEFKHRMYGAYMGAQCQVMQENAEQTWWQNANLTGIKEGEMVEVQHVYEHHADEEPDYYEFDDCKLLLTPLSAITDEDAIEVARILDPWLIENMEHHITRNKYELKISGKHDPDRYMQIMWVDGAFFCSDNDNVKSRAIDKLREWGYDCGYAEIPSLIDAGLAIDKTTLNN